MGWLEAIILALIQGICEFLPVSSSGHLSLFQNFFGLADMENILFYDVLLHFGTLIAVFAAFWKDIVEIVREFFRIFTDKSNEKAPPARRMSLFIIIATIPLVLMLFFNSVIDYITGVPVLIGLLLIVTALVLFVGDKCANGQKTEKTMRLSDAVFVGVTQLVATLPGLSRSGLTISAGLYRGFDRKLAVKFSFLMSIPAVLGATVLEAGKAVNQGVDTSLLPMMLVGVAISAVVGYVAIRLVRKLISGDKFGYFAWYCLVAGAFTVIVSLVS